MSIFKNTVSIGLLVLSLACDARALFTIGESNNTLKFSGILCLNGKGPANCQRFSSTKQTLTIKTTVPHRTYPIAGIYINNSDVTFANAGIECSMYQNGYCLFSVSDTNPKTISLVNNPTTLSLGPSVLPQWLNTQNNSVTLTTTGGLPPYTYTSLTALPTGVSFNSSTGVLSANAYSVIPGIYNIKIKVNDSNTPSTSTTLDYTLVINAELIISPATVPDAIQVNSPFRIQMQSSPIMGGCGNTYVYTATNLPSFLNLDTNTGLITGTPSIGDVGDYSFKIESGNPNCSGIISYHINVYSNIVIYPTSSQLVPAILNKAYHYYFTSSGGGGTYTYAYKKPSEPRLPNFTPGLPTGLTLDSSGVISGKPTQEGGFYFIIESTDQYGLKASATYYMNVNHDVSLSPTSGYQFNDAILGQAYTASSNITVSGGEGPYSFVLTNPSSQGFYLNTSGASTTIKSNAPKQSGLNLITIFAFDKNNLYSYVTYLINVIEGTITFTPSTLSGTWIANSTTYSTASNPYAVINAVNKTDPTTFNLHSGRLPPGVQLTTQANQAKIYGVPTATGTYKFTLYAQDSGISAAHGISQTYSITISPSFYLSPSNNIFITGPRTIYTLEGGSGNFTISPLSGTEMNNCSAQLQNRDIIFSCNEAWLQALAFIPNVISIPFSFTITDTNTNVTTTYNGSVEPGAGV